MAVEVIPEEVEIAVDSCYTIFSKDLMMNRVCQQIVPIILTQKQYDY
jgi:hypothetical protein